MKQFLIVYKDLYWRPNRNGYTTQIVDAGLYSEDEAKRQQESGRNPRDWAVPLDEEIARLRPNLEIVQKILEMHSK